MRKNPETDLAIIGLPWILSLLQYSTHIHNISINWHSVNENHFFFDDIPQSVDSLTCHGNHHGILPLEPLSSYFSFFKSIPEPWPLLDIFPYADQRMLSNRYKIKKTWFIHSQKEMIKHALYPKIYHNGKRWFVNEFGPYFSIIQITPYADHLWNRTHLNLKDDALFCSKPHENRFLLSWNANITGAPIKWSIYKDLYWLENWQDPGPTAIWCIGTPFNNEKFLNKKKLFESFLKKIVFLARQHPFRIR